MSATAYEAIMSVIDPLIEEGYIITISRGENWIGYDGLVYKVVVMDGEILVTEARSGLLEEALSDAYLDTPERGKTK